MMTLAVGAYARSARAQVEPRSMPNLSAEQWREDLLYMAEEMEAAHRNLYHTVSREAFAAAVDDLYAAIPSLLDHEVIVGLTRIVAMVGDGHTELWIGPGSPSGFRQYPVRFYVFEEGLFIQAIAAEHEDEVGARVLQIGRLSAQEAFERVSEIVARDNEMFLRYYVPTFLSMPEVLHALGIIDDMERATFHLEGRDGRPRTLVLAPREANPGLMHKGIEPPAEFFGHGFVSARDMSVTPLYLRQTRRVNTITYLPDSRTLYAQVNAIQNSEEESLPEFAARLYRRADERRPERLVIDLRQNGGGNNQLNLPLVHGLIERPWLNRPDRAFALIGRLTFSAASHLVTKLEIHTNATFVGEPTGGSPNHYGDVRRIILPHSRLFVDASAIYWQNSQPWDRRPWTPPDVAAPLSFADYVAGHDPAMEAVLAFEPQVPLLEQLAAAAEEGASPARLADITRKFTDDPRNAYAGVTTTQVNRLGYRFVRASRIDAALTIFRFNVDRHPDYANGFDSLGETLARVGRTEEAIAAYERALALDPDGRVGDHARQQIERLRGRD